MEINGSHSESGISESYKQFPFEIVELDEVTQKRVLLHFKGPLAGLVHVGPEKWIMPKNYAVTAEQLYNIEARPDDIYISTFARSGTTWTSEMMWLICNDLNYEVSKATEINSRFPFLEMSSVMGMSSDKELKDVNNPIMDLFPPRTLELLAKMTSPRLIKTHLPIKLMPHNALQKKCKIVYVARNPKDVLVSLYHFSRNPGFMFDGTFEQFVDYFMDDLIAWGPYFEHIKDGWSRRNDKNVLFLYYEDLVMDLKGSLKKLSAFLEHPLSDSEIPELMEHLNIQNFKQNTSVNMEQLLNFGVSKWEMVRRGQIGGNPEITPEIMEKIDEWTEQQLSGTDLKFPHQMRHKMEMYNLKANNQGKK